MGGFTLVEVMVALVVAGLVLGGAYGIVGSVADARTHTAAARAELFPGPAARAAIDGWLRSAALLEGGGAFIGVEGGTGALSRDALSFTVEDGGALHPGPRRIRLWTEHGAGLRAEVASLRPMDGEPPDTLSLAPAAAGLQAQYRTQSRDETVWLDAWRSDRALPEAVRITILPPPEAAADPRAGGLPRVLRMPILVPLRWNPDASDSRERSDAADAAGP
jgi:prepilin-type N-terminal cleavage/methylation domain-containing protein